MREFSDKPVVLAWPVELLRGSGQGERELGALEGLVQAQVRWVAHGKREDWPTELLRWQGYLVNEATRLLACRTLFDSLRLTMGGARALEQAAITMGYSSSRSAAYLSAHTDVMVRQGLRLPPHRRTLIDALGASVDELYASRLASGPQWEAEDHYRLLLDGAELDAVVRGRDARPRYSPVGEA